MPGFWEGHGIDPSGYFPSLPRSFTHSHHDSPCFESLNSTITFPILDDSPLYLLCCFHPAGPGFASTDLETRTLFDGSFTFDHSADFKVVSLHSFLHLDWGLFFPRICVDFLPILIGRYVAPRLLSAFASRGHLFFVTSLIVDDLCTSFYLLTNRTISRPKMELSSLR